jgi:hypothetical protein
MFTGPKSRAITRRTNGSGDRPKRCQAMRPAPRQHFSNDLFVHLQTNLPFFTMQQHAAFIGLPSGKQAD